MKILFLSHTFPYPPNEGIKRPAYHLIKEFSKNNEVTLLSFILPNEKKYVDELKKYCKHIETITWQPSKNVIKRFLLTLFSSLPYNIHQFFSKEFCYTLEKLLQSEKYDIIFFDFLTTAIYSRKITISIPKILHYYDAMSMLFYRNFLVDKNVIKKIYWYIQYKKIINFEHQFSSMFDKVTVVATKDKSWLTEKSGLNNSKVEVIPNGVDIEYFVPYGKQEVENIRKKYNISTPSLLFRGIMNFQPNIDACLWFLNNVYPIVKKHIPEIKFYIVGPGTPKKIKKYVNKDIIVTGYVEDLRVYIAATSINICPMISGSGIKNKILESLAMGKPSVITSIACEGIPELKDGENVLIADTPQEFADKIILLFKNNDLYQKIAYNGRKLVEKNYTWEKAVKKFYKLFEELCRGDSTL